MAETLILTVGPTAASAPVESVPLALPPSAVVMTPGVASKRKLSRLPLPLPFAMTVMLSAGRVRPSSRITPRDTACRREFFRRMTDSARVQISLLGVIRVSRHCSLSRVLRAGAAGRRRDLRNKLLIDVLLQTGLGL